MRQVCEDEWRIRFHTWRMDSEGIQLGKMQGANDSKGRDDLEFVWKNRTSTFQNLLNDLFLPAYPSYPYDYNGLLFNELFIINVALAAHHVCKQNYQPESKPNQFKRYIPSNCGQT